MLPPVAAPVPSVPPSPARIIPLPKSLNAPVSEIDPPLPGAAPLPLPPLPAITESELVVVKPNAPAGYNADVSNC